MLTTVCAALVDACWGWPASVVATRNLDGRVPVDLHSMVEVRTPDGVVVLDPLFAIGPVPVDGTAARDAWHGAVDVETDGRHAYRWSTPTGADARYRSIAGPLDADDIAAFLHISITHTGMSARRWWRIAGPTTCASITDDVDHGPLLKRYTFAGGAWSCDQVFVDRWTDATAAAVAHVWDH